MLAQNISAERHIRMLLLFSHVWLFATPWTASHQASLSFTISWSLLKLTSVELVMPSNHLILFHPLLLSSIFPSTGVFSNESALCIRWPKYRSFRFRTSVLSMNIQGWFPLGIDWFDLLAVQRTLKGLLHHNLKASILRHSAFFTVQLWHPYMNTGKTMALTNMDFCQKSDVSAF